MISDSGNAALLIGRRLLLLFSPFIQRGKLIRRVRREKKMTTKPTVFTLIAVTLVMAVTLVIALSEWYISA